MKKIKYSILFFVVVIFGTACTKTDDMPTPIKPLENQIFEKIRNCRSIDVRRSTFNTLSNLEKVAFWQQRLDKFTEENKLTSEQISLVKHVKTLIKPEYYVHGSPENIGFDLVVLPEIILSLQPYFSELEIYNMIFDIYPETKITNSSDTEGKDQPKLCICAIGSKYTCGRINEIWLKGNGSKSVGPGVGVGIEYGECKGRNCTTDSWGCGGLWTQECDGEKCVYH